MPVLPNLPFQRTESWEERLEEGGGGDSSSRPARPCLALMKLNTHSRKHTHIGDCLVHASRFISTLILFCPFVQFNMLTWDFLKQSKSLCFAFHTSFRIIWDCLPSITKFSSAKTFNYNREKPHTNRFIMYILYLLFPFKSAEGCVVELVPPLWRNTETL